MDEWQPVTVRLSRPIQAHGEEVTELTLREPTIGDLDGVQVTVSGDGCTVDLGAVARIAAGMAGVPPSAARTISIRDLPALTGPVFDFLGASLPISTSS